MTNTPNTFAWCDLGCIPPTPVYKATLYLFEKTGHHRIMAWAIPMNTGTKEEWRQWFQKRLDEAITHRDDKLNGRLGYRRRQDEYQVDLNRDARQLRRMLQFRQRHYQFQTDIFRNRFGHLLAKYDE